MADNPSPSVEQELKPCPNPECPKSSPSIDIDCGNDERVYCETCGANTGWYKGFGPPNGRAIAAWNHRQALADRLGEIATMMEKHVENWPHPKQFKTAVALIDKTLEASLRSNSPGESAPLSSTPPTPAFDRPSDPTKDAWNEWTAPPTLCQRTLEEAAKACAALLSKMAKNRRDRADEDLADEVDCIAEQIDDAIRSLKAKPASEGEG